MTKFVSNANDLRLDNDVKLFLVVSDAILDASVAAWEANMPMIMSVRLQPFARSATRP